jgi:hypothetical protein
MLSRIKKIAKSAIASVGTFAVLSTTALAQSPEDLVGSYDNQASGNLLSFVQATINLAIGLSALIAVGFLVFSGIQYIMANGDEGKVEKATKGITYSVIGLVICFISVLIVNFVLEYVIK